MSNPIDISIIIASKSRYNPLQRTLDSLIKTYNNDVFDKVEIIVKVDKKFVRQRFIEILKKSPFNYQVVYNKLRGYINIYRMQNYMCRIASGNIIWSLGDDVLVSGDWFNEMRTARLRFKDRVCVISPDDDWSTCPAISREWLEAVGKMSPIPNTDTWLRDIGRKVGRYILLKTTRVHYQQRQVRKKTTTNRKYVRKIPHMIPLAAIMIKKYIESKSYAK